jgi:hypothetical protein
MLMAGQTAAAAILVEVYETSTTYNQRERFCTRKQFAMLIAAEQVD